MTHESESLDHNDDSQPDALSDPKRYESAFGYEPDYQHQKLLDTYRKNNPEAFCRDSMLTTKPARAWQRKAATNKPKQQLFGSLWREGDLAVLFGESGAGKSLLAIQIAEAIARGRLALSEPGAVATGFLKMPTANRRLPTGQPVLYFDFQHTAEQFAERYSCESPIPGKLPVHYRFSPNLSITRFDDFEIPDAFNGDLARYFDHSLNQTLAERACRIIIIDNLAWLDPTSTGTSKMIRRMRSLKMYCHTTGASILVLANSKPRRALPSSPPYEGGMAALTHYGGGRGGSLHRGMKPLDLNDLTGGSQIAEPADTVFAIAHSTYAPEIRYVKPVRTRSGSDRAPSVRTGSSSDWALLQSDEVLTYQLERSSGFQKSSPPYEGGVAAAAADGVVLSSSNPHSESRNPQSEGPFLGLTYLGPSNESDHLRNYAAEALAQQQAHTRELHRLSRRSATQAIIEGMRDGSYGRYLKGE